MKNKTIIAVCSATLVIMALTTAVFHLTQGGYKAYMRGRKHYDEGRYAEALPLFDKAHNLMPHNREIIRYLLWTHDKLGRREEARRFLETLVQQDPEDIETLLWLADLSASMRDFACAEGLYRRAFNLRPSVALRKKLAETLAWQKKYSEALAELEKLRQDVPDDPGITELFAHVSLWDHRYDQAIDAYKQLLKRPGADKKLYFYIAEALRFSGRNNEAVEYYKKYASHY